uniref:Putative tail protein n=1 Tax=viral metagenome TaxID=1070528 RepID=A0A6M3KPF7_9ZZZZ
MPLNDAFEHNGATILASEAPAPLGPPGSNVIAWVVTAPDKDDSIGFNSPFRVSNTQLAQKLDTTGSELGTAWHAVTEVLKKAAVAQYVIVVPEGATPAETEANIIGGIDPATGKRTGIAALVECAERPTLIAAPGFSHKKPVIDALAAMAKRLRARVVVDGTSTTTEALNTLLDSLGGEGSGHERVYLAESMPQIYSRAAKGDIYVAPSIMAMTAFASVEQWESPGNQSVAINGLSRVIEYNLLDKSTEGDLINKNGGSYFARTSMGGFSLIGNRAVTGKFISFVGLEDVIARKLEASAQSAMAKQMTANFWEQEVKKIDLFVQDLVAAQVIPGGSVYLHPTLNTVESYKNGTWYVVIDYGRYSPNEHTVFHLNSVDNIVNTFIEGVLQ